MSIEAHIDIEHTHFKLYSDLQLSATGITAIVGKSGSGKTSLLRAIGGLDRHRKTAVRFNNTIWQDENIFVPIHKRRIGYIFQNPQLFKHLDVKGNIDFAWKRRNKGDEDNALLLDEILAIFDIENLLNHKVANLSGGECQRVLLARTIATNPSLLLLDEALSSVDTTTKYQLLNTLKSLSDRLKIPMLYVTHDHFEAATLTDKHLLVDSGSTTFVDHAIHTNRMTITQAMTKLKSVSDTFVHVFDNNNISIELYQPKLIDYQQPHDLDEIYVIASGHGTFINGDSTQPFEKGEVLFVPAKQEHRFIDFSPDFSTWVIFFKCN